MKFKLYKDIIPEYTALEQILYNRDIPREKQEQWLNAGWDEINSWTLLDEQKMRYAAQLVKDTIDNNKNIILVIDADCDGWTSAAIFINYFYSINPDWINNGHLYWIQHKGKEHGLSDVADIILEDFTNISLVVCPDAASNDRAEHAKLSNAGIDVICLDHHEIEKDSEDATVINVQLCDYPNKALTGAGVTWQFCRAFDEIYNYDYANNFIDLAALGNCGDMSDYRELETRALINLGLQNLKNPFFYNMSKKNDYSISQMNGLNYYSMAFYVVPFINSCVRSGTQEEKELVFKSFLLPHAFEKVESSNRRHKGEIVPLYEEAILIAERVKRRQTKLQDEGMDFLVKQIKQNNLNDNEIIVCLCEPGDVEKNIAGLVANKIMSLYQKPCLVLTKSKTKNDDEYYYRGSGRNYGRSEIGDLRQLCLDTELVEYAQGHASAFGVSIPEKNLNGFIATTNKMCAEYDSEPTYWVDYIWNNKHEIDADKILDIGEFNIYGQEIPESYVALNRIPITPDMVTLMSPDKHPTLKIKIGDIEIIKFGSSQEEYEEYCDEDLVLSGVFKCAVNEWMGNRTAQLKVVDIELDEEWVF